MSTLRWTVLLFAVVALIGCTPPPPRTATVKGTVTIDGDTPLATGEISFYPDSGKTPTVLPIANGKYEGEVPVGTYTIMIYSYQVTTLPPGVPSAGTPSRVNVIPPRYNQKSNEKRAVTEGGPHVFDFQVTSE